MNVFLSGVFGEARSIGDRRHATRFSLNEKEGRVKRREFIKTTGMASLAAAMPRISGAYAAGTDTIRVGVVGCGGRGTGAALDCLNSSPGVEVVAMFDLFKDRIESSLKKITEAHPDKVKVAPDRMFSGFDGYKKLSSVPEVNLVINLSPRIPADAAKGGRRGE